MQQVMETSSAACLSQKHFVPSPSLWDSPNQLPWASLVSEKITKTPKHRAGPHPQPVWASKMELSWRSQCLCTTEEIESKLFYSGQKQYKIKFQWDKWWVPLHQIRMWGLSGTAEKAHIMQGRSSKPAAEWPISKKMGVYLGRCGTSRTCTFYSEWWGPQSSKALHKYEIANRELRWTAHLKYCPGKKCW